MKVMSRIMIRSPLVWLILTLWLPAAAQSTNPEDIHEWQPARPLLLNNNQNYPASPQVRWVHNNRYVSYTDYQSAIKCDIPLVPLSPAFVAQDIARAMKAVADWQLANPSSHRLTEWTSGALYTGLTAWALMSEDPYYKNALFKIGQTTGWHLGPRLYHADDHAVGYMYQELYDLYRDPAMITPTRAGLDSILENPSAETLVRGEQKGEERWWRCDALFMGPPVWTRMSLITGDKKYIDFMNKEWWATTDYLYEKKEHLFFRDDSYFAKREDNGKKIFRSRGNGWVIAGIARVLQNMPTDYPDRPKYEQLFKDMAAKLLAIQPQDGLWRPSLLDPDAYAEAETSGSGFFTFALAWGINNGLLDRAAYLPAVQKAWTGLVKAVHPDGKPGFVPPIGADPKQVTADQTESYGVGAFLLAGSEVYKLALFGDATKMSVTVRNPITAFRLPETVELPWNQLAGSGLSRDNISVFDTKTNRFITTQVLDDAEGKPEALLFQAEWAHNEARTFWIAAWPSQISMPQSAIRSFSMYVPQRMDDFAWENDRIAFRMYGKALEVETVSSGVDVWVKSVRYPILEKWYKLNDYHNDHGEGMDFYKVGPTRGCGGLAIWHNGQMIGSRNYRTQKILTNGPIRTTFELGYDPWQVGDRSISEVKRISIDMGSNLSRFESHFSAANRDQDIDIAMGIVKVSAGGDMCYNLKNGWMAYNPPLDPKDGGVYCGIVTGPVKGLKYIDQTDHGVLVATASAAAPWVYYAGAGWNKSGDFPDRAAWLDYVEQFARQLTNPLKLNIKK